VEEKVSPDCFILELDALRRAERKEEHRRGGGGERGEDAEDEDRERRGFQERWVGKLAAEAG